MKFAWGRRVISAAVLIGVLVFVTTIAQAADAPPSWNDGKAKQPIIEFVAKVTKQGSPRLRAARRAHRDVRQRRHTPGGAADVF